MKNKDLKYYLNLNYDIIIRKIDKYDEVFYEVTTRELDPLTFYGVGDTIEEAIRSLEEVKHELFPYYLENNIEIPEPEPIEEDLPSGKFIVRTSPSVHLKLLRQAKKSKQSLNACINSIFEQYTTGDALVESFTRVFDHSITARLEKMEKSWDQQFEESLRWAPHLTVKEQDYAKEKAA